MLQYLKYYNSNEDLKTKEENHDNSVVIYDPNEFMIKKILEEFLTNKENNPEDLDILFKLTWKPVFASDYKEGIEPIPFPTDFRSSQPRTFHWNKLAPSADAMGDSTLFFREKLRSLVTSVLSK